MMFLPLSLAVIVGTQNGKDPYHALIASYWKEPKDAFSRTRLDNAKFRAQEAKASALTRFSFGAMAVVAMDKGATQWVNNHYATEATKLLKRSELKLSPSYCYVVAKLGGLGFKITDFELEAAKLYYEAKHDGISSYLYADVLMHASTPNIRAMALPFALEAHAKQGDNLLNRWQVAGGYFHKGRFTKERAMYKAAIESYDKALELAKNKTHIEILKQYRALAIQGLEGKAGSV